MPLKKPSLRTALPSESLNELPFFIFLTVVLGGMYGFTIATSPAVRVPVRLIPLTILMLLHIFLYWTSPWFTRSRNSTLGYLLAQGLLALAMNLLAQNLAFIMGLYMGLIGICTGLLKLSRLGLGVMGYYLALSLLSYRLVMGTSSWLTWIVSAIPGTVFVIIYVYLYNQQVEARARAQALADDLERANRQMAEYASQVEELTLATERQRMARELHDTLSQGLAGLILQLEAADAHLADQRSERARLIVQQTMERARSTLADARRAIGDLRQTPEAPGDPVAALRIEVDRFTEATGIPCTLDLSLPAPLPEHLGEVVRRIIAESLTNIARHAQASRAHLRLGVQDGWLEVILQDNGHGFDPRNVDDQTGHYGLLGMRERARLAGGTLEIDSQPGAGTTLRVKLPVGGGE